MLLSTVLYSQFEGIMTNEKIWPYNELCGSAKTARKRGTQIQIQSSL